jgi:hypothetical protein
VAARPLLRSVVGATYDERRRAATKHGPSCGGEGSHCWNLSVRSKREIVSDPDWVGSDASLSWFAMI